MISNQVEYFQLNKEQKLDLRHLLPPDVLVGADNDYSYVVVAVVEDNPVGIIIFDAIKKVRESVFRVRWLFVLPEYRHMGIAKGLVDYLKLTVKKCGIKSCSFIILEQENNLGELEVFEEFINSKVDIVTQKDGRAFFHSIAELKESIAISLNVKDIGGYDFNRVSLNKYLKFVADISEKTKEDWMIDDSETLDGLDSKISSALIGKDGNIVCALLVKRDDLGVVYPFELYCDNSTMKNVVFEVIKSSILKLFKNSSDDAMIYFVCKNPVTEDLLKKIFPKLSCVNFHSLYLNLED